MLHTILNFHGLVGVLRRQSTGDTPRHQPGYGVDQGTLKLYLLLAIRLVVAQTMSGCVLLAISSLANLFLTLHNALHSRFNTMFQLKFESTSS